MNRINRGTTRTVRFVPHRTLRPFKFLWDENNALAKRLGIAFTVDENVRNVYQKLNLDLDSVNGEWILPVPATFIVKDGIVRYSFLDADYMRRQDPVDLLAAIRAVNH
ncbi:MAG: hypothetical protein WC504_11345 [Methylobacter sp.]